MPVSLHPLFVALMLTVLLIAGGTSAQGSEAILRFHSDITVCRDASLQVCETINVQSAGERMVHGIHRDFTTRYHTWYGSRRVGFAVQSVTRDGMSEPYRLENIADGTRIRIGDRDCLLPPGLHTYVLTYRTDRQLRYLHNYDELHWNVTGNGWSYPILAADATITLPSHPPTERLRLAGYTGTQESQTKQLAWWNLGNGRCYFSTTGPLDPNVPLTVIVGIPKGVVAMQTPWQIFVQDNPILIYGSYAILALFLVYLLFWALVGQDPPPGTIIPRFAPPKELSPAAVRYLRKMGYDRKTFAATLISLAVKGVITIAERDNIFSIRRYGYGYGSKASQADPAVSQANGGSVTEEEEHLALTLLNISPFLLLTSENHEQIEEAMEQEQDILQRQFQGTLFFDNHAFLKFGIVLSAFLTLFVSFRAMGNPGETMSLIVGLAVTGLAVYLAATVVFKMWVNGFTEVVEQFGMLSMALYTTGAVVLLFIVGWGFLRSGFSLGLPLLLLIMGGINVLFAHMLKAPTKQGRKVLDEIDGFRMYLETAEGDRLKELYPPEKTPQLFEQYLPYAVALDVEEAWGRHFTDVLHEVDASVGGYMLSWYDSISWKINDFQHFSGALHQSLISNGASSSAMASTVPPLEK